MESFAGGCGCGCDGGVVFDGDGWKKRLEGWARKVEEQRWHFTWVGEVRAFPM